MVELYTNVRIFDGEHEQLARGMSVLVEGNKIAKIGKSITHPKEGTAIDAKGIDTRGVWQFLQLEAHH